MIRLLALLTVCLATASRASGAYDLCDIFNGEASAGCGSWYQGKAVVKKSDGRCGNWFQGKAVVQKIAGCGSWYQGRAVVWKEDPAPAPAPQPAKKVTKK